MTTLAVILTAYGARGAAALPELAAALAAQTQVPDELWVLTEDIPTHVVARQAWLARSVWLQDLPTPRGLDGRYAVIPYSAKINHALDRTAADYVAYLTDDSRPAPDKYRSMARVLDSGVGVVYCGQQRNGAAYPADTLVGDAYCVLDHTQVMHRRSDDRWPVELDHMRLGDAVFWRRLHARFGPFHPVPGDLLDVTDQTPDGISASW